MSTIKRPSGAQVRKKRKRQKIESQQMKEGLRNWLKPSDDETGGSSHDADERLEPGEDCEVKEEVAIDADIWQKLGHISGDEGIHDNEKLHASELSELAPEEKEKNLSTEKDSKSSTTASSNDTSEEAEIDFNNPETWIPITDQRRCLLVQHGPEQAGDPNRLSMSTDGRHFSEDSYNKVLPNKQIVKRNWLFYSVAARACFCFPCIVFSQSKTLTSGLCHPEKGVNDWKHLAEKISQHENNSVHKDYCLQWKELQQRLKDGQTIDNDIQQAIQAEKYKWRSILKIVVDCILFCARNNVALRGSSESIGERRSGIFLSCLELVSHYNQQLLDHIKKTKDIQDAGKKLYVTYFSPDIQNEVIQILRNRVKSEITSRVKKAKYYSILFDATPDVSRQEQVTQIIRYIQIDDDQCSIEESFLDFIDTEEKTGAGLAQEIMNKLAADGLVLADCRGQGYDNGANMAGIYNGAQALIKQQNSKARFVPCAAHSLNLVGVHSASDSAMMITFFGTVQSVYNYFSSSTSRWQKLKSVLNVSLKSHTDTRWSSRAAAVTALQTQISEVYKLLQEISLDNGANTESRSGADRLLNCIDFPFVCLLQMWNRVLQQIDRVNRSLQAKNISVLTAARMLNGLVDSVQELRNSGTTELFSEAKSVAADLRIEPLFPSKRKRKVKRMPSEKAQDEGHHLTAEQLFDRECNTVYDRILSELTSRFTQLQAVASDFGFLDGKVLFETPIKDLKQAAADLSLKYSDDLDSTEFQVEVESFKYQAKALMPSKEPSPLELLQLLHRLALEDVYPNIHIALRLFLTMPVTVASCERSFSKLKLIKNFLRSSMGQERLSGLAILSIEYDVASKLNYDDVIDTFAAAKARKVNL